MQRFALDIMGLSIIISIITAASVYFSLTGLLVRPMARLTKNMLRFSQNPEDAGASSRRRTVPTKSA